MGFCSGGDHQFGCLRGRPNHIRDGESSPGSLGVSIQKDHALVKSSLTAWHLSHSRLNVLTDASASPLDWGWWTLLLRWAMPLFLRKCVKGADVSTPSPSQANMVGQPLE